MGFGDFLLSKNRLALIMSLPCNEPRLCRAAFEEGADAVKVHMNVSHRASGTHFGRLAEERGRFEEMLSFAAGPMGVVLGGSLEAAGLDALEARKLGFSFYSVYAHHIPAWVLPMGKSLMAACDYSYGLEEMSGFRKFGADALEASIIHGEEYGTPLCMRDLIAYSSIVEASGLPVVVPTQRKILPEDVPALARTGIRGLMIGAIVTGKTEDSIRSAVGRFREAVEKAGI